MNKQTVFQWVAIAILGVGVVMAFASSGHLKSNGFTPGATTALNMLAENYIPYVLYNNGYNSAKPMNLTSTLDVSGASNFTSTVGIGSSGTALNRVNAGTCYLRPYALTILASTTAKVDCQATRLWNATGVNPTALTGITLNDTVSVTLSTTTAGTTAGGLQITGQSASSTAGFIELYITNSTGATYSWPVIAGQASGTATYIVAN